MENLKRLLSQRSATARLGLNDRTFRKYREQGFIKPIGVTETNTFVFDADHIDEVARKLTPGFQPFRSRLVSTNCKRIN